MENFIKYLTTSSSDIKWGIYITSIGKSIFKPNNPYPSRKHPYSYYFNWKKGRILNEYQIIYITEGSGIFENELGKTNVEEGSIMLIYPNEWHRYKPNKETGWTELYIGFKGDFVGNFIEQLEISRQKPIIKTGIKEQFIESFLNIFDLAKNEQTNFQQIASGYLLSFFGLIGATIKEDSFDNDKISEAIAKIRLVIRENIEVELDLKKLATEFNFSYSYFRKMFKKHTGISPKQYHLQLKIFKAKELLLTTDKSVKEICFDLGFQSTSYFSRIFKQKTGTTPILLKQTTN